MTPERWNKLVDHVQQKVEDHYWEHDGLDETMIDPFIINTEDSSDGSSSSWEDTSSEDSGSGGE